MYVCVYVCACVRERVCVLVRVCVCVCVGVCVLDQVISTKAFQTWALLIASTDLCW